MSKSSKSSTLVIQGASITDTVYTHVDPRTGKNINFNVTRIANDEVVRQLPIRDVLVTREDALMVLHHRGLERHRLERLVASKEELEPVLFAKMDDGTHLLIDGNHRFVAAYMRGQETVRAKIVKKAIWSRYLVTGLPEEKDVERLKKSFSGIA